MMNIALPIRLLVVLLVCVLFSAPTIAQDDALLADATRATLSAGAYAFDFALAFSIEGLDTFAVSADITGAGALDKTGSSPAFQLLLDGNLLLGSMQEIPVDAELRLADGALYWSSPAGEGWQSMTQNDAAAEFSHLFLMDSTLTALPDILAAVMTLDPAQFAPAIRLEDGAAGDAHFQTVLSLPDLMLLPEFGDVARTTLNMLLEDMGMYYMSDDDVPAFLASLASLFAESSVTLDQYVGSDDTRVHRAKLAIDAPLDPANFLGMSGTPVHGALTLDVTLRDFDQPQAVTAPEGASAAATFPLPPVPDPVTDIPATAGANVRLTGAAPETTAASVGGDAPFAVTLDARAGDVYSFTAVSDLLDLRIDVLDASGRSIAANDNHGTPDESIGYVDARLNNVIIPADGVYTVQVTDIFGESGDFTFTVEQSATGAPVGAGFQQIVVGRTDEAQPVFAFPFAARAGDFVTVTARGLGFNYDAHAVLLAPDGSALAESDDHGSATFGLGIYDAQIRNAFIPADGTYTASVDEYSGYEGIFILTINTRR